MSEVNGSPEVNQRQLSLRLGIALGLTNVLLKNLVQKGYVRVSNASWKRRLYNLTPEGLAHKLRLTTGYISRVLDHYQNVRQTLREQMEGLDVNEESHIAVCGTNEFAELVYLGLKEIGIEDIDIFSAPDSGASEKFLGMPVRDIRSLQSSAYDRVVVGVLHPPESVKLEFEGLGLDSQQLVVLFSDCRAGEGK